MRRTRNVHRPASCCSPEPPWGSPTLPRVIRLSVIVPCHNVAGYAAQTLRSLRHSAGPEIELLLVDDASTDETPAVLAAGAERLPGARVLSLPRNVGLAAARNAGIREARGEYLTFLDGDDFVAAGYYPQLLAVIERLGCAMVRTDHVQVHGRERTVHRIGHGPRGVVSRPRDAILPADRATSVDSPNAWAGIYHRRLVDNGLLYFSEHLRTCEDRPWNWRLHLRADSFAVVGLLGVFYRRGVSTSLTQITDERQLDFLPAFDQIVADTVQDPDGDRLLPKALRSYCAMVLHHLGRRDRYEREAAARLTRRCREALLRLPAEPLGEVVTRLDPARAAQLRDLMAAA
jgi:hypothetical protein